MVPEKPVKAVGINPLTTASHPHGWPQPYNCHPNSEGLVWSYASSFPAGVDELTLAQVKVSVGVFIMTLTSLRIFSFLPIFNWTLGAQASVPVWVSALFLSVAG